MKLLKNKVFKSVFCCAGLSLMLSCSNQPSASMPKGGWLQLQPLGTPTARHEAAVIAYDDKVYLIGGRRVNPTDVYNPATNSWQEKSKPPLEIHHFQPVVWGDAIYIIGAMTGDWPNEKPLDKVVIYYPEQDKFEYGTTIPESRRRGGAGAVVYNNKIYWLGGITDGHMEGAKAWLDEFDPVTGLWRTLPDAPHARDHFQAAVIDGKLYAAGGRTTSHKTGQGIDLTVANVDVYDFTQGHWLPADKTPRLPTQRAGNATVAWRDSLVVAGGESIAQQLAHSEVEVFNAHFKQWSRWPNLLQGRHGSGFAVVNKTLYIASGCGERGGDPELTTIERLLLP